MLTLTKNKAGYCNPEQLVVDVYLKGIEIGVGVSFGFFGLILIIVFFIRACYTVDLAPVTKCSSRINNPFSPPCAFANGFPYSSSWLSFSFGQERP